MIEVTLSQFESYLYVKLGLKKANYYRTLYRLCEDYFDDKAFTEDSAQSFLLSLNSVSPATYNNYLKALKKVSNLLGYTFLDNYKLKKTEQPYISILEEQEIIKVLSVAYQEDDRRAIALETFVRTGLRANELISLEWKDYHIHNIFVQRTKSSRSRVVEILDDLSNKIEKLRGNHPRYVFATGKGMLDRKAFNKYLVFCLKKANIEKHITSHKLRHSYATLCAAKGISHFAISDILGHTDMQTTKGYIHTTTAMKRDAAKKTSLGQYKLSYDEMVEELNRYISSLYSDKAKVEIIKKDGYFEVKVKRN